MAFSYGFYNSLNGDRRYKAEEFNDLVGSLLTDGVFENVGDKLFVTAGSGMDINVGSGKAWFDNTWSLNDSTMVLSVPQSDITRPRYDTVVLEVNTDLSVRENKIKIVSGSPAVTPTKPVLVNTDKIHQHPLAHILVQAAALEITASNIEIVVGRTDCPFVTGVLQKTDITDLYNQWDGDFQTWFNNLKEQLTSNVVTNLQAQIDALGERVSDASETANEAKTGVASLEKKTENSTDVGSIFSVAYGYSKTISNALPCTGGLYSPTAYPNLFNTIGYNYGGSGTATTISFSYPISGLYTVGVYPDIHTKRYYVLACTAAAPNYSGAGYLVVYDQNLNRISSNHISIVSSLGAYNRILGVTNGLVLMQTSNGDYYCSTDAGLTWSAISIGVSVTNSHYAFCSKGAYIFGWKSLGSSSSTIAAVFIGLNGQASSIGTIATYSGNGGSTASGVDSYTNGPQALLATISSSILLDGTTILWTSGTTIRQANSNSPLVILYDSENSMYYCPYGMRLGYWSTKISFTSVESVLLLDLDDPEAGNLDYNTWYSSTSTTMILNNRSFLCVVRHKKTSSSSESEVADLRVYNVDGATVSKMEVNTNLVHTGQGFYWYGTSDFIFGTSRITNLHFKVPMRNRPNKIYIRF